MSALDEDGTLPCELEAVFSLANEIHQGLSNVQPCLSTDQLEQVYDVLFHRLLPDRLKTLAMPDSSLQHAWSQLLARLDQHQHPASWASFMTRVLCFLSTNKGQDIGQFFMNAWHLVAQPAEETHEGLGRAILRACIDSIDSIAGGEAVELADGELGQLASEDLSSLMGCVIASLRRNGNPPAASPPSSARTGRANAGEPENAVLAVSVCGIRLMFDVASYILAALPWGEFRTGGSKWTSQGGETRTALEGALETWRWDFHVEVVRLLRTCRVEEVRKHLVLTIARPLYGEWGHIGALEELWAFIATAGEESAELHLALLCLLAEDLMRFLDLPVRHAQALWDLIYLGVSNMSDLCRRRGLHMLQRVIKWADESSHGVDEESSTEQSSKSQSSPGPIGGTLGTTEIFSGEALVQWKEYARVLEVLEMETETHLLDQVVPTVERLCSKLSPATTRAGAAPMATEFRWIAIPLGVLITTGSVARRRKLVYRIVTRDLGLGKLTDQGAGGGNGVDDHGLEHMEERWVAEVLLPALDHVGWHSSVGNGSLHDFSQSVTEFLRSYVRTLSVPRVANFLALVLAAIRQRSIGTTDALCSILAAFDIGYGTRVPAMGRDILFQLKEMLLVVLPPLNQAKRMLLLDGVVQILETFTDYEQLVVSLPAQREMFVSPSLRLVMSILSAIPDDLVNRWYLPHLATWLAALPVQPEGTGSVAGTGSVDDESQQQTLRMEMYRRRMAAYVEGETEHAGNGNCDSGRLAGDIAEGRSLCVLGLVLSEAFKHEDDRHQVLSSGLSPLVRILNKCWKDHYVSGTRVHAALVLFSAWRATVDVRDETENWRWRPLEACVSEVVDLVATRLGWLIENARRYPSEDTNGRIDGEDAQVLLAALSEAMKSTASTAKFSADPRTHRSPVLHSSAVKLRDSCVSLLTARQAVPLLPAAHLLAIASLEVVVRAQGLLHSQEAEHDRDQPRFVDGGLSSACAARVVLSLLRKKVEGRIASESGSIVLGSDSDWGGILRQHELRKWSCISLLLPVALGGEDGAGDGMGQDFSITVCDAIVEGIRASLRAELPMAMACFQTVFPCYLQALPHDERAAGFENVFELVWGAFKELRRPQLSVVRDLINGALHPVALAMPELVAAQGVSGKEQHSCLVDAFNFILKFGAENKPNVLRALVGRLTTQWFHSPGSVLNLVPGMVEVLLFNDWGRGIETISNDEASVAEAPRLMLLLFIECKLIPAAASGLEDSRQILRALTFELMELQGCTAFRQSSITDSVVHGRKLRSWQALCVLCGYLCDTALSKVDDLVLEIVDAIATWFWPVHRRTALPPVRQQMEVFAVRMCKAYPDRFLGAVVKELADFRLPGQVLCSLLIVSGHTLVGKNPVASAVHRLDLLEACLPWMVGTHVMGRMIAQLVCYSVLPESVKDGDGAQLEGLFFFLRDNPDMIKMRKRQLETFKQTDCVVMCTVSGMMEAHGTRSDGEITPTHMCELLQQTMDEIWNEALHDKTRTLEEGRAWTQTTAAVKKGTWFEEHAEEPRDADNHIQQKILPWDALDLAVELASAASLQQSTAAGRMRQSVVMCATLVDKVPNLAGLARTCEIFAASSLVVRDSRVLKNPAFSKISTGAEQWLPIEELDEKELLPWIRSVKRRGYTVVGVEQTNNSVCLTKVEFPKRCVLMLGRENSGLPLEVINEMDLCCQIPQQGVLRSLNAHVSGALVLWEYTRQMLVAPP